MRSGERLGHGPGQRRVDVGAPGDGDPHADRSWSDFASSASMSTYMVGTPASTVARCSAAACRAAGRREGRDQRHPRARDQRVQDRAGDAADVVEGQRRDQDVVRAGRLPLLLAAGGREQAARG